MEKPKSQPFCNFQSSHSHEKFGGRRAIPSPGHCVPVRAGCVLARRAIRVCVISGSVATGQKREMTLIADERGCVDQLARFFPALPAVRFPVRVTPLQPAQGKLQERTVLEYGTEECAIFLSTLPLEFADRVKLERDGGRPAEATVIALQYEEGRKAVAVRFLQGPCEWMRQP